MALISIEDRLEFESDLCLVTAEVKGGVPKEYANRKYQHWDIRETYYTKTHLNPFLLNISNPVPYLEILTKRLRNGRITPSSRQIRSQTVLDYLTSVVQRFTNLGSDNLRLNRFGKIVFFDCPNSLGAGEIRTNHLFVLSHSQFLSSWQS